MPYKYEDRKCDMCGKIRRVRNKTLATTCRSCKPKERIKPRLKCIVCEKPRQLGYFNCCSKKCRLAAVTRVERLCKTCNTIFIMLASKLPPINKTTNARGKYCSKYCYTQAQKGLRLGEFDPEA